MKSTKFSFKKDYKLLFTKHNEMFEYKRYWNHDASLYKPLRIDWVARYYLWQIIVSVYEFLVRPLFALMVQHGRLNESEEITLSGKQIRISQLKTYTL